MKGDDYSGLVFYNQNGIVFSKTEKQLIAENIKRILNTRKGERVNEPNFGSDVKKFLFMPQLSIDDLIAEIIVSVERNEPRVTVNSCTLTSADQNDVVNINLNLTINKVESENMTIGVKI